jgi:hypothetical protein
VSGSDRQRRYRHRQSCGDVVVTLTLSQAETAKLCRLDCLKITRLEDRGAIVDALHLLLDSVDETQK